MDKKTMARHGSTIIVVLFKIRHTYQTFPYSKAVPHTSIFTDDPHDNFTPSSENGALKKGHKSLYALLHPTPPPSPLDSDEFSQYSCVSGGKSRTRRISTTHQRDQHRRKVSPISISLGHCRSPKDCKTGMARNGRRFPVQSTVAQ